MLDTFIPSALAEEEEKQNITTSAPAKVAVQNFENCIAIECYLLYGYLVNDRLGLGTIELSVLKLYDRGSIRMRIKMFPLLALALASAGTFVIANDALAKYEEPSYSTSEKDGNFEIRDYPSVIAAEVEVSGSGESAANNAFKIIAGYIFGKNVSKTKVAMTVPVTEKISSEKIAMTIPVVTDKKQQNMIMRFYMPSKYTLETLPEPNDKRIKLIKLPSARYAVIRFSGFGSEKSCVHHEKLLNDFVKNKNLVASEAMVRAFYNPPWTLPFMRRNEIWQKLPSQSLDEQTKKD